MDNIESIQKHIRNYIMVFGALAILTVITVGASYLQVGVVSAIVIAVIIATVKGSLVASIFMHLLSEKKFVYILLGVTALLFLVLMFVTLFTVNDQVGIHVS
ncbi:MAG TPA: cytochrome C oxidase subunit IV family protein [Candidatus Marinimicrobia bacterium]|jgi:cytochrome c oxidase subunit 4|nr:cytochrome C oxidase subunit IV family protein [Candidatus Neomarinimicrobiota bacterium]HJL78430.1 cytochrome C oxidase subunit IV family protein [Candidatus Neomarinimicrobiota bacterium]|tara:strand:- start:1561 stop:1866 length:306 start_codon:yes stop_codon:yes gene_type:complete